MSNDEEMVDEMVRELYPLIIEELHSQPTDNSSTIFTVVILFGICGILTAFIVTGYKGREGGVWFVLGGLLGPIGVLIALLIPPKKRYPTRWKNVHCVEKR